MPGNSKGAACTAGKTGSEDTSGVNEQKLTQKLQSWLESEPIEASALLETSTCPWPAWSWTATWSELTAV